MLISFGDPVNVTTTPVVLKYIGSDGCSAVITDSVGNSTTISAGKQITLSNTGVYSTVEVANSPGCNCSGELHQTTTAQSSGGPVGATEQINSVTLPDVCVNIDGAPGRVFPVASINPQTNTQAGVVYLDNMGNQVVGTITVADPCDCDCVDCP